MAILSLKSRGLALAQYVLLQVRQYIIGKASTVQLFLSCHSSTHAIWIASSFFSFEFFGSSLKPSRPVTHLCRSVNRTVIGSMSGNLSARAIAMSSVDVQVNDLFILDFLDAFVFQRLCNRGIHDQLRQMHCCLA